MNDARAKEMDDFIDRIWDRIGSLENVHYFITDLYNRWQATRPGKTLTGGWPRKDKKAENE